MELENLVILFYASNHCYTRVTDAKDKAEGLSIDTSKGTWDYKYFDASWNNVPIGEARGPFYNSNKIKEGIIGVYDRTNTEHLDNMASHAISFTENHLGLYLED